MINLFGLALMWIPWRTALKYPSIIRFWHRLFPVDVMYAILKFWLRWWIFCADLILLDCLRNLYLWTSSWAVCSMMLISGPSILMSLIVYLIVAMIYALWIWNTWTCLHLWLEYFIISIHKGFMSFYPWKLKIWVMSIWNCLVMELSSRLNRI